MATLIVPGGVLPSIGKWHSSLLCDLQWSRKRGWLVGAALHVRGLQMGWGDRIVPYLAATVALSLLAVLSCFTEYLSNSLEGG